MPNLTPLPNSSITKKDNLQSQLYLSPKIGEIWQTFQQKSVPIILNPVTNIVFFVGTLLGLIANQLSNGYIFVVCAILIGVIVGIFYESRKFVIYQKYAIPLPIIINISNPSSSENALSSIFGIIDEEVNYANHQNNLQKIIGIEKQDLIFNYSGDIFDSVQLQTFLQIVRYNLEKLKAKTPRNTIVYLAYIGPISVGILVGTLFGTDGVRVFQYNKSSDSYYPVVEISDRRLKEDIIEFEKFERTLLPATKTQNKVCVVVDAASHKISLEDSAIKNYGDIIYLKSKTSGTIQADEDWLQYSREIFKVLNIAQQQGYEEIKLVYSMPIALGILVGMATQQYWRILLTQYDQQTQSYRDLFALNDFSYYRGQ
jgi:hypothetical protein